MKALTVTEHTLVGVMGDPPHPHGNCFSVKCDDGKYYRVVNFNLENVEALVEQGLKWPIECQAIGERHVVFMDGRIGERWYQDRYCEICCPRVLLPVTQRQRHEREIARGQRVEGDGFVQFDYTKEAEFR